MFVTKTYKLFLFELLIILQIICNENYKHIKIKLMNSD